MKAVVVNSSPIIALSMLSKLDLLWDLFDEVFVPAAVYDEVTDKNATKNIGSEELADAVLNQYVIVHHSEYALEAHHSSRLHKGELEVVSSAKDLGIDLLVIDDYLARKFAESQGFMTIGVVGILLLAKKMGRIEEVKTYLDRLIAEGYYLSTKIYLEVLARAGETTD